MTKIRIAKVAGLAVGMSLAFGASTAGAQTIADLQAQINALLAQLAALQGGSVGTTACTFTRSLTIGARGADVTCLQNYLTSTGHFTYAGGATGYFGPITRSAVAAWQAANGVAPAVGYFGPISQARYSAIAGSVTVPGTPTTPGAGITTPGAEGTLAAVLYATPAAGTKVYEGDNQKKVAGIELEAKLSDVRIERIKVKLDCSTCTPGTDRDFYDDIADRMYVMDGNTVLASVDLNSSTVVEETSGNYYVTITGFNVVIPKDTKKVLSIAVDAQSNFDSTFNGDTWTVTIPAEGIRGVDGAGINLYAPASGTTLARDFTSEADLKDSATLAISLNANTPDTQQAICEGGTDSDECDELEVARVDFKVEDDDVTVTDLVVDIVRGGGNNVASGTVAYLYDGSSLIGSASIVGTSATAMSATFSDIDWTVPADTTRTLTVKMDVVDAALAADTFAVNIGVTTAVATNVTSENSEGDSITETGSAQGKTITVRNVGPEITLVSRSITTTGAPQSSATDTFSTSTLQATFNVRIKAVGGDLFLGKVASTSDATQGPAFSKTGATNSFKLYAAGVASTVNNATTTSYTIPSTCVDSTPAETCTLAEGAETTIEVTYLLPGRTTASAAIAASLYAVGLEKVNWAPASTGAIQSTTFMAGDIDWRTTGVSFP